MNTNQENIEMLALIQQNSIRISNLEEKYNKFQCVYTKLEKHDETLLMHDQRMKTIMKKLLELHTDLQHLASIRQHIMTACAALGGAIAAWLIHFLPHF